MIQIKAKDGDGNFINDLAQWDTGITIYLEHELITDAYEVHFANSETGTAAVVESAYEDGVLSADIPDTLLQETDPIFGYVCAENGGTSKSILSFKIKIVPRAMPSDYEI